MKWNREEGCVRRRRGAGVKRWGVEAAVEGRGGKASTAGLKDQARQDLFLMALATTAAMAATYMLVATYWHAGTRVSEDKCQELALLHETVRKLGLDGFPEYTESCISLLHTMEPFTAVCRNVFHEMNRRAQRAVRRLRWCLRCATQLTFRCVAQLTHTLEKTVVAIAQWYDHTITTMTDLHSQGNMAVKKDDLSQDNLAESDLSQNNLAENDLS